MPETSAAADEAGSTSTRSGPDRGDGESYAMRITCASLQSLKTLIDQGLINYETLDEVFGSRGLFWCGADVTKELLVSLRLQLQLYINTKMEIHENVYI